MTATSSDAYGSSSSSAKSNIRFIVMGEDMDATTAIHTVQAAAKEKSTTDIYTISGMKVSNSSSLPAGIYVKGGKKFIVK